MGPPPDHAGEWEVRLGAKAELRYELGQFFKRLLFCLSGSLPLNLGSVFSVV